MNIFEPSERNLVLTFHYPNNIPDDSTLETCIQQSGANILQKASNGAQLYLLSESHAYARAFEDDFLFQLCTCGEAEPVKSVIPLVETMQPRGVTLFYFVGRPVVHGRWPLTTVELKHYLPKGMAVEQKSYEHGQLFIATIGNQLYTAQGQHQALALKGCQNLEAFDKSETRNGLAIFDMIPTQGMEQEFSPGYTGAWMFDDGYFSMHISPEATGSCGGKEGLNYASVHSYSTGSRIIPSQLIEFFKPQIVENVVPADVNHSRLLQVQT